MSPQNLVNRLHEEHGLPLSEIASHLGVSRVAVWNWQTGRSSPRTASLHKLNKLASDNLTATPAGLDDTSFSDVILEAKNLIADALQIDPDQITVTINR